MNAEGHLVIIDPAVPPRPTATWNQSNDRLPADAMLLFYLAMVLVDAVIVAVVATV